MLSNWNLAQSKFFMCSVFDVQIVLLFRIKNNKNTWHQHFKNWWLLNFNHHGICGQVAIKKIMKSTVPTVTMAHCMTSFPARDGFWMRVFPCMDWEKWYTPPKLTNVHLKRSHFKGTVVFQPLLFRGHVSCPGGSFKLLASVCSKVQIRHHCMCWREHLLCPMNSCPINAFKNQDYSDYSDYSIHEVSWKRTRWILDGMITEDHTVSLWSSKWFFESIKSSRNWRLKKNKSKKTTTPKPYPKPPTKKQIFSI